MFRALRIPLLLLVAILQSTDGRGRVIGYGAQAIKVC